MLLVVPVNLCENYDSEEARLVWQMYILPWVTFWCQYAWKKLLDLLSLLELLEINDLAWIKVLVGPLSSQRGCMLKEKWNLIASWQTTRYIAAWTGVTQHVSK